MNYEQWALAAAIPGIQDSIESLQTKLAAYQSRIAEIESGRVKKRGRPRNQPPTGDEQLVFTKHKLHPRDADHPGHAKWLKLMQRVADKRWKSMSKAQRTELGRKIRAGKKLSPAKSGGLSWQGMTAEEKSAEMMRRRAVAQGKAPSKNIRPYQRQLIENRAKPNGAATA